ITLDPQIMRTLDMMPVQQTGISQLITALISQITGLHAAGQNQQKQQYDGHRAFSWASKNNWFQYSGVFKQFLRQLHSCVVNYARSLITPALVAHAHANVHEELEKALLVFQHGAPEWRVIQCYRTVHQCPGGTVVKIRRNIFQL